MAVGNQALDTGAQAAQALTQYGTQAMHSLGLFVPGLAVIEDKDQFRYDVKDNRRLQQVAVSRVFRKSGTYIF